MSSTLDNLKNRLKSDSTEQTGMMPKHNVRMFSATIKELKEAAAANPSHPVAEVYSRLKSSDDKVVTVDAVDITCLIANCAVVVTKTVDASGREVITKSQGASLSPKRELPAPKKPDQSDAPK